MCAPSMPKPPNPYDTANAQGNVNQETAYAQQRINQTNQITPYGSLTYTNSGEPITYNKFNQELYDQTKASMQKKGKGVPDPNDPAFNAEVSLGDRWDAVQTLSPEQQGLYDRQMGLQTGTLDVASEQLGRVSGALGSPLDFGNAPAQRTAIPGRVQSGGTVRGLDPNDYSADRQRVEAALMERMDPYLQQRREQEQARLLNQGFADPRSQGYTSAMDEVYRGENDARMSAILNAGQEQSRIQDAAISRQGFDNQAVAQRFGQNTTQLNAQAAAAAFANQARQQAIQEQMLLRQTPINEISALMSGSQVQQPSFVNTPQSSIQAPDLQGAIYANYEAQMQQAQMQADQNAAMIQGVASLGGSGLGAFGAINPFGWGKK